MVKIRIFDPISPKALEDLRSVADVVNEGWDFDIAIIRSKTMVSKDFIEKSSNLKLVLRAGVGLDNVDQECCEKKGIEVKNTAEASTISVAELVFALLLSIARRTVQKTEEIKKGYWKKEGGFELSGKTLGIIGYGRIGREVAKIAKSFGMIVVAYDPFYEKTDVPMLTLNELLHVSDVITLHTPLTSSTNEIINSKTIKEMKDGVILINTSRGEVINEEDLYSALVQGKISFAGLDVFHSEPPDKKLLKLENVVLTPHIGGSTADASDRVGDAVVEQVKHYIMRRRKYADKQQLKENLYLVTVSSEDRPGITASLTEILSQYNVSILDAQQATIQGILALSFLIEIEESTRGAIVKALEEKGRDLKLNLKIVPFGELKTRKKRLYALTCLTAIPRGEVLTRVSKILFKHNANIETIRQLAGEDLVALELSVDVSGSSDLEKLKQEIMGAGKELSFDVALQKENAFRKSKRMIVFNMEGTLIDTNILVEIAKMAGTYEDYLKLVDRTFESEFDRKQFLRQSVALLKGVSVDALEYIANKLVLTNGTKELVRLVKTMGYKIAVISSSFTFFTDKLREELDLDYAYSNTLVIENNALSGELKDPIIDGEEKAKIMLELAKKEKIPLDQIVAVGNGVDDVDMLNRAGLGIVFQTKGEYMGGFAASIVQTNLKSILYMLGASEESLA